MQLAKSNSVITNKITPFFFLITQLFSKNKSHYITKQCLIKVKTVRNVLTLPHQYDGVIVLGLNRPGSEVSVHRTHLEQVWSNALHRSLSASEKHS